MRTLPYIFDWKRIQSEDAYHIEYSITDICNRNCACCSHLAPLAKSPAFVEVEEFRRVVKIMRKVIPDAHTFWLTGGEPTLHPEFVMLLQILRETYPDTYVGIYSNGTTLFNYESDEKFWDFIRENGIVWGITNYGAETDLYKDLFYRHGCADEYTFIRDGRMFFNLTNYSHDQPITKEKYEKCGWERSKINIRKGKIYNCPASEFADLFNAYFHTDLIITDHDYLIVNDDITRKQIDDFKGPMPFCGQCAAENRFSRHTHNRKSNCDISEWSEFQ